MKTKSELYEKIAQLRAKLYDAEFALLRCEKNAIVFKQDASPLSKAGFEEIEKIAANAKNILLKIEK